ncbi:LysR family transcriptional regulator [Leifsonia poae]|uniref:LysR family transcriptional regulator n=1 Tax=Leifsonia poae TaxID=110933 RepID=UPI0022F25381|nr:LysR family transcriptional regulator [Leifsonia poae]
MELRDIEIFLTLAEELHFGRTAEKLYISAPRVSQSIAQQEKRIGAPLFERTSRKVTLTPLGVQLRDDLEAGYRRILKGVEDARNTAHHGPETLTFGVMGPMWQDLAPMTAVFRSRFPQVDFRLREIRIDDPFTPIRNGDIDVALLWLPVEEPDLHVGPTAFTEPIVLMVGPAHELAGRASVSLEELAAYDILPSGLPVPDYWEAAVFPTARRVTESDAPTPTREEVLWSITNDSESVAFACGQGLKYYDRGTAVYIPIDETPTLSWGMVHRTGQIGRWARELVGIATELGPIDLEFEFDPGRLHRLHLAG